MNYSDRTNCHGCSVANDYRDLNGLTNYSCDQKCLCRFNSERSTKDKMDYDIYVLGKQVNLETANYQNQNSSCGPKENYKYVHRR